MSSWPCPQISVWLYAHASLSWTSAHGLLSRPTCRLALALCRTFALTGPFTWNGFHPMFPLIFQRLCALHTPCVQHFTRISADPPVFGTMCKLMKYVQKHLLMENLCTLQISRARSFHGFCARAAYCVVLYCIFVYSQTWATRRTAPIYNKPIRYINA